VYREALATCALTVEAKRSKHRNAWHQILDGYVMTKKYKRTKSIKGKKNITDTHGPVHVLIRVLN
jgi:hypothetical protein